MCKEVIYSIDVINSLERKYQSALGRQDFWNNNNTTSPLADKILKKCSHKKKGKGHKAI
jgi:hypothetical protein